MIHALHAPTGEALAKPVAAGDIERLADAAGTLWVDLQDASEQEAGVLSRVFRFHPLAIEDCVAETNHAKVDSYENYVYLVVHGVKKSAERGRLETEEVDFFLGRTFVVTYHAGSVKSIEDVRRRCLEVPGASASAEMVLHAILDRLADSYVEKIEALEEEVDGLEQRLFRKHLAGRPVLHEIFSLKKEMLQLRRVANPQREVLNRFARGEFAVVSPAAAPHFRDVFDHLYRVSEMIDSFRDVVTSALETYLTIVANRTNEVMKVLTVIATILMTASLMAGIYGMNFEYLPGKDSQGAFWLFLGLMAAAALGMLFSFKKRKWI